jgi:hypothetical protein
MACVVASDGRLEHAVADSGDQQSAHRRRAGLLLDDDFE